MHTAWTFCCYGPEFVMGGENCGDMKQTFILRSGYDGVDISVMMTSPASDAIHGSSVTPVAVLQIAHGMRGFKERFLPMMEFMSEHGIVCVANDHRGHGASVKDHEGRGDIYSGGYAAMVDDMRMVTEWAHAEYPDLPVYLLGHSMGSLAARTYMKTHDNLIQGVVLCGTPGNHPALELARLFTRILSFADHDMRLPYIQSIASDIYNRGFRSEGEYAWLTSDRDARKRFADSEMGAFTYTVGALDEMLALMHETYSKDDWQVKNPGVHVYFISGEDDPVMRGESNFHKSAIMMAALGYTDVTSAIYSGMRHEVLNETDRVSVWEDILAHLLTWSNKVE